MKTIDIIGVQMDLGASRRGVNMGPMAIRCSGLCEELEELGFAVNDLGDIAPLASGATAPYMRNYEQVIELNTRLYSMVFLPWRKITFRWSWAEITASLPAAFLPPCATIGKSG